MNEDEPLTNEESRASMLELAAIMDLRRQLADAHARIGELQKQIQKNTAAVIAERHYGLEDPRPARMSWISDHDPIRPSILHSHKKTNTEVLQVTNYIDPYCLQLFRGMTDKMERQVKNRNMDALFVGMQERGLFRQFVRKLDHEIIYTASIEVAKI